MRNEKIRVTYVTSSGFKKEECRVLEKLGVLSDGTRIVDQFYFHIIEVPIPETLEADLILLVTAEVMKAYARIRVPCIVEHAGLIFEDYKGQSYPGGLTKAMWNALGTRFLKETNSAGRRAVARAVVAYCDGKRVYTFTGECQGHLAETPRGDRTFYWDTVFVPDNEDGTKGNQTFAEIVAAGGLEAKILKISQSTRAMKEFLEHRRLVGTPELWT